ncbi:putative siderophore-binding lipoprotein YfiY precursor [compost metagenome]
MVQQKRNTLTVLSVLLALVLVLSACGDKSSQTSSSPAPTTAYTVQHAMGSTTIPAAPKRVIVLTNEGTEAALSMGIKPVGIVRAWGLDPIYKHLTEELKDVTLLGDENQPNLELIASLKPDLIIGNKFRQEKVYTQLSAIAPTVFSERINGDWQINYKLYAEALNKKTEGQAKFDAFEKRITDLKAKLGDKINSKVSIVRFNPGGIVRIYFNDTFSGVVLKKIGLKRPDVQDKNEFSANVGKERIPDMEGDILFYFTYDDSKGEAVKAEQEWQKEALWTNLEVVKKGNVHRVDDGIWNSSGGIIAANLMLDDLQKYMLSK